MWYVNPVPVHHLPAQLHFSNIYHTILLLSYPHPIRSPCCGLWIILCKPLIRNITLLLPAVQRSFRLSCTYAHILPGMTSSQLAGTYSGNVKSAGLILYLFRYCSVTFSFTRLQSVSVCSPVRPYSLISSEDSPFSACHRSGIHLSAPCPPSLKNMQTSVSPLPMPELQLQFFSSSLFLQFVYFSGLLFRTSTKVENVSVLRS